jgi:septation ring formation regulator EzrA
MTAEGGHAMTTTESLEQIAAHVRDIESELQHLSEHLRQIKKELRETRDWPYSAVGYAEEEAEAAAERRRQP